MSRTLSLRRRRSPSRPSSPRPLAARSCSTSPTTPRASSTRTSTPPSPRAGRRRPDRPVTIQQSHGGSAKQARAVIDGLEADVRDPRPRLRHRRRGRGRPPAEGLAEAAAQQQLALHLDHRLPRPQGQPQGDQGLGRPREAGRAGHHPEPQDLRGRALELPRGLGLRAEAAGRKRGQGQGVRDRRLPERPRARLRGSRLHHHLRAARDRRRAPRLGERGLPGHQGARPGQGRHRGPVPQHPRRAPGRGGGQGRGQEGHARARPGLPGVSLHARGPGDRRPALLPPAPRGGGEEARGDVPQGRPLHHRRGLRRLAEGPETPLRGRGGL